MSGRLDEIRERWAEVTPWPWSQDENIPTKLCGVDGVTFAWVLTGGDTSGTWTQQNQRDMDALANAPADVAWLVDELATFRDANERAHLTLLAVMAERDEARARLTLEGIRAAVAATVNSPLIDRALVDLIEGDGPDTTREDEVRRLVDLVAAIFEVPRE